MHEEMDNFQSGQAVKDEGARRCARCNHDISEYAPGLTICAACEDEEAE